MTSTFQDLQEPDNPLNGRRLQSAESMIEIFHEIKERKPFLFELRGDHGFMLTVGFAGDKGSVQYSPCDGSPPYAMAISHESVDNDKCVEFLTGNTPTPIPERFCLPIRFLEEVIREFIQSGKKSELVTWEEV